MPVVDFLNASLFNYYPFRTPAVGFSNRTIVDSQFIIGPATDFNYQDDTLRFTGVTDAGTDWTFSFKTSNHEANFAFTIPKDADFGSIYWANATEGYEYGRGFVQVGELDDVAEIVVDMALLATQIQNLSGQGVSTINIANQTTTIPWDDECQTGDNPGFPRSYVVEDQDLTGDITFESARHTAVALDTIQNAIVISPVTNPIEGGEIPCDPIRVYPPGVTEESLNLVGCGELLYMINGIMADDETFAFDLFGSRGFEIEQSTEGDNDSILIIRLHPALKLSPEIVEESCP